jgi:hypothetical protein
MNVLTPGEQAVWAARFNQTQIDVMDALHARAAKAGNITPEQAMEMLSHATRTAVEQAHSAVVTLRRIRVGEGEAADMLAAIVGPGLAPLPAPLEGLVGPWDFLREPPPGMMFREGQTETAVRIVHIPTNIAVHVATERQQEQNKQKALEILQAKLFKIEEEKRKAEIEGRQISKTTEIEWGNQIRSYVLHPYKMVKDHRTDYETSNVEAVLEKGELDGFIEAEKGL